MDNICNNCLHGDLCAKSEHLLEPILECSQYLGKVKVRMSDGIYDLIIDDEWVGARVSADNMFDLLSDFGYIEFEVEIDD